MIMVRTAAMEMWAVLAFGRHLQDAPWTLGDSRRRTWLELRSWLAYAVEVWSRRRKEPVDVAQMIAAWLPIIKTLSTAHSKDELDAAEFSVDRWLAPLLTAPVRQVREFYAGLVDALKTEPDVPLFVWSAFEAWNEVILKKAPDEGIMRLKKELAGEIAVLVEQEVKPDIAAAIRGALQWRAEEDLVKVRDALKAGAKPRLKGRQSCLFLTVPKSDGGELAVML